MKKRILFVAVMLCLILTACGSKEPKRRAELSDSLFSRYEQTLKWIEEYENGGSEEDLIAGLMVVAETSEKYGEDDYYERSLALWSRSYIQAVGLHDEWKKEIAREVLKGNMYEDYESTVGEKTYKDGIDEECAFLVEMAMIHLLNCKDGEEDWSLTTRIIEMEIEDMAALDLKEYPLRELNNIILMGELGGFISGEEKTPSEIDAEIIKLQTMLHGE